MSPVIRRPSIAPAARRLRAALLALGLAALGGCAVFEPDPLADERHALESARRRWASQTLRDYEFVYKADCNCPPDLTRWSLVTVRDGAVDTVRFVDGGYPAMIGTTAYPTVEQLFDRIDFALMRRARTIRVSYDPRMGFPTSAFIDLEGGVADDEFGFDVTAVTSIAR